MRIGIAGYGNLGKSVELIARDFADVEIVGIFTRREGVKSYGAPVYSFDTLLEQRVPIDVLILCYGSSSDLPTFTPRLSGLYNTVDTFDNHRLIAEHKARVGQTALETSHVSVISVGWDPGLLSLIRLYLSAFIPKCSQNTFWGRGVSQGHSEALRRIPGVKRAIQYTVPKSEALSLASLVSYAIDDVDRHKRVCYIAADKKDEDSIKERVLSMENYFSDYETEIHFIAEDDPLFEASAPSHRGRIYALGKSGVYTENRHCAFFDLELGSNPDLTANIAVAGARVCKRFYDRKAYGAYTIFDIPPSEFCDSKGENANKYL